MTAALVDVSDLDLAFPTHVIGRIIPAWEDIPEEYKRDNHPCAAAANKLFFGAPVRLTVRDGIDVTKARRMVDAALGSFEPKHEHKIAGVAYLIDSFFEAS